MRARRIDRRGRDFGKDLTCKELGCKELAWKELAQVLRARGIALTLSILCAIVTPRAAVAGDLTYLAHEPAERSDHPPLIVLLHGSGADEKDMIGLWSQLPRSFTVVSPRAPFPSGSGGYRWYRGTPTAATPGGRDADIAISRTIVDRVVADAIARYDADPKRVFLAGFSQGAVMVYEMALREPGRFRGAAVLSGTLFSSALNARAVTKDRTHDAFFLGHGTADDRIPFSSATAARAALARLGAPTAFHAYPGMRHGIGDAETRDLADWLTARLANDPNAR